MGVKPTQLRRVGVSAAAFTLMELLAVIAIIGILLAISIPAVTNLMKASALNAASREVSSTLSLARQYAITQRTTTRVVFPFSQTGIADMQYRAYAVASSNRAGAAWEYMGKVEYLPVGAVFLQSGIGALDSLQIDSNFPFPATNSPPVQLAYIEFRPTGAASQTATLTIQEGFINNSGTPTTTSPNAVTTIVDNVVGRIRVTRP
jgi:uncharacterized protein (TIGR02596 family)